MHAVAQKPPQAEIDKIHSELERKQKEQDAFKMPIVGDGEPVKFFEHGVRSVRYSLAFVQRRNEKGMELRLANGLVKPNVPHIDDPRLKYGHEFGSTWGAWEMTDWKQALDNQIADLDKRVKVLEEYINSPVTDKKKGA